MFGNNNFLKRSKKKYSDDNNINTSKRTIGPISMDFKKVLNNQEQQLKNIISSSEGSKDIDFDKLIVHVKNGKGGKDRTTFITPVAKKYILQYLAWNRHKSVYVFTTRLDGRYNNNSFGEVMRDMSKRCGIHIHPHRFRRTLATDLARKGMPIQEIQKLLGHSKISTTQGYIETSTEKVEASYRQYVA